MYVSKVNESYISSKVLRKLLNLSNENIDISDYSIDLVVEWELQLENKSDGINGMSIYVNNYYGDIYWNMYIEDNLTENDINNLVDNGEAELLNDDEIEGFIKIDKSKIKLNVAYKFEWSNTNEIAIYPQDVDFNVTGDDSIEMTLNF